MIAPFHVLVCLYIQEVVWNPCFSLYFVLLIAFIYQNKYYQVRNITGTEDKG